MLILRPKINEPPSNKTHLICAKKGLATCAGLTCLTWEANFCLVRNKIVLLDSYPHNPKACMGMYHNDVTGITALRLSIGPFILCSPMTSLQIEEARHPNPLRTDQIQ